MTERELAEQMARATGRAARWVFDWARGRVVHAVGGPARARVIALFGGVLALSGADSSTVGAVAPQLEHALHIGNAGIGLLSSVALLVGAMFVIPVGLLVDRFRRIPMLATSIVLWSIASLLSAFAGSYADLLLTRVALGAVTATAGPAIASLTGDYFPASERGRVYSYILAGEVTGTAAGFIVSGTVASVISWRAAFALLAIPGLYLARTLWRTVPEPLRGGQSRLYPGAVEIVQAGDGPPPRDGSETDGAGRLPGDRPQPQDSGATQPPSDELAQETARELGIAPDPDLVLREDAERMTLANAVRYTLRIPTNVLLILSSSLGYFFFSGLQTFALLFVRGHYHAGQATAEFVLVLLVAGALVGTVLSGRLTDALLRKGVLEARIYVPAICYLGAAALLVPGFISSTLSPAIWFDVGGAALLSAANPGLDAARLDIMPARLWGRAESVRTFLRSLAQAAAPLAFGGIADLIAGIVPAQTPVGTHTGVVSPSAARGLEIAFLVLLSSLIAAGIFLLRARSSYPRDVATAAASQAAQPPAGGSQSDGPGAGPEPVQPPAGASAVQPRADPDSSG